MGRHRYTCSILPNIRAITNMATVLLRADVLHLFLCIVCLTVAHLLTGCGSGATEGSATVMDQLATPVPTPVPVNQRQCPRHRWSSHAVLVLVLLIQKSPQWLAGKDGQ